ncbi:MAG: MFS transporter [Gammaproteobacteria bacterium]|nr:MFS transporter [Gammaproteobacteria bacterium]
MATTTDRAQLDRRRLQGNLARTLVLGFFQVFLVIMPIAVPFFQSKGLSMQEVLSLQALFGLVVLLTEVPSGYVADIFGRQQTLVAGAVFCGIGHTLLITADGFWTLALFELALGIGHSLVSGADIALLYDTELALGRGEHEQRQVVGRLYSVRTLSEAVAGLVCSVLLLWSMDLAVYVQAAVGWVPLLVALTLVEPPGRRMESTGHLANMAYICRYLMTNSAVLRLAFLALCVWSLTTFYAVWLLQKLWEQQGLGLSHFGYLWGLLSLAAALAGRWAHKAEETLGTTGVLLFIGLSPALGYLGLDAFGIVGGYIASLTFWVSRGFGLVILRDALNRRVPSEFRATANSLASFGFRGAFVLTGPIVGYAFDLWGMSVTLNLLAAATLVIFAGLIVPLVLAARTQAAEAPQPG